MAPIDSSPFTPTVSCLVVSRNASLLNRLVRSLGEARRFWKDTDEVLCSWNGNPEDEALLQADAHPPLRITARSAYHFATNVNALADQARGDLLVVLNDDVILDRGSLDRAIQILQSRPEVGVVGGRLRTSAGRLGHAGILFANQGVPYNRFRPDRLGSLINPDALAVRESGPMPAVTGALMVLRREDFQAIRLRESFSVCGEDVALCLDLYDKLDKWAYYASDVTAIHDEKSTRGETLDHYYLHQVAELVRERLRKNPALRAQQAYWAVQEADELEGIVHRLREDNRQREEQWSEKEKEWSDKWSEKEKEWAMMAEASERNLLELAEKEKNCLAVLEATRENVRELEIAQQNAADQKRSDNRKLGEMQGKLNRALLDQESLKHSRSWRLTAPYRRLGRLLQRWRRSS